MRDPLGMYPHRFEPAPEGAAAARTFLLLHGTGGNEDDLLGVGRELDPGSNLLSPRGNVLENGVPRFFRRLREGVFDLEDVRRRAGELAEWIQGAERAYGFDRSRLTAVGYSNGANIGAAVLLLHPGVIPSAVLWRAMVPIEPERRPELRGARVLMTSGSMDPIVPAENAAALATMLREGG